jgi:hypothetical protein
MMKIHKFKRFRLIFDIFEEKKISENVEDEKKVGVSGVMDKGVSRLVSVNSI